jgi:3D (Asp-Asp-Asp) domain-containing protein
VSFTVTAYCTGKTTAAGTRVTQGVVAADPRVLPLGTVIRLAGLDGRYNGTYTVMDTGLKVRGRRLDVYLRDCAEAVRFGRRSGRVSIVR